MSASDRMGRPILSGAISENHDPNCPYLAVILDVVTPIFAGEGKGNRPMRWCLSWRSKTGRQSRRWSAAYGTHRCAAIAVQGALLCLALLQHAVASPSFDVSAAERVLQRVLPHYASQFDLGAIERRDGREMFRISGSHGRVRIEGSTSSALLFGVNWYLKYVAHVQISPNGDQIPARRLPLPRQTIEKETPYPYRYALNENVDGYTSPYWDWSRWEREIDVLALSGINAVLVERGTDSVLYR